MTEPPQAVDWATTEGEREEIGCAIRSSSSEPYDSRPAELELRMAMAIAAGVADVGRSRMRPCPSGCWYCRCRSVRSLDGAIHNLVPMRAGQGNMQVPQVQKRVT
jgi:hypothetical protein